MARWCAILVVLTLWLVACSAQPTSAPTPSTTRNLALNATDVLPTSRPSATATLRHTETPTPTFAPTDTPTPVLLNPLQIEYLRQRDYPGSDLTVEQTLAPGANYNQYLSSYKSDGLKIYALLTVPKGPKPATGWPVIIFNHGYISPSQYRTTEQYAAYVDALARRGYIVFKSDYRGYGNSQGPISSGYGSPAYTIDVLNALASLKRYPDADPERIGMWGHSTGGQVTLRAMVVTKDIKAGVIWAGVVGTYPELLNWRQPSASDPSLPLNVRRWREELLAQYGTPEQNPQFWAGISPNTYVADLSGPLQLHHDLADSEAPEQFSQELYDQAKQAGKTVEFYTYPGDDHNLAQSFALAMQRTIAFFDRYVKSIGN